MRDFQQMGRSPVYGRSAMCATSHPLASEAGIAVLRGGGNAVDAAIACAAVLAVVEPHMTGIGGDCFALLFKPGEGLRALSGAGCAPAAIDADRIRRDMPDGIAEHSPHGVTVPCAVDAWARLNADYGTRGLDELLAPAIAFAENGFAVAPRVALDWGGLVDKLSRHDGARRHLLQNGRAPDVGEIVHFPALAASLRAIASDGRDAFYCGALTDDMVATLQALGGVHSHDDFARQRAVYVDPIALDYGGATLHELPPSNQGIAALMMLNIIERLGVADNEPHSAGHYHILLEAARLAYRARDEFVADPDHSSVPVDHLLSGALADTLAARIDPKKRVEDLGPIPRPSGSDTIYLTVADSGGMVVSFINSLYSSFGSGIVGLKSGIALHNRGQGFVLNAGHPNCIAPGKRPMHTLVPAMLMRDGRPALSFGVMGAHFQPMGQVYVMTNVLNFAMDPQQALDFPRIFFNNGALAAERCVSPEIVTGLQNMGHDVVQAERPWGGGQAIAFDHDRGVLIGGSDSRKDGMAIGY